MVFLNTTGLYIDMENIAINKSKFQIMNFILNAIDSGWSVTKNDDKYVFKKKHEGRREVFMADYLEKFIDANMDLDKYSLGTTK
jgi:hypothetical protein